MNTQKTAFITGANRGIGLETARQLGRLGILPVIGARTDAAGNEAVATLRAEGIEAESLVIDVTSPEDRRRAAVFFEERGGLDILINNAGVHLEGEPGVQRLYSASTVPEEVLRKTLEANFFAPVALTQLLLPLLKKSPAGRIVNLSSILGSLSLHANPQSPIYEMKSAAYDTSKAAINSYTIQLAHELRGGSVKVNSAHPGWVQTAMGGRSAPMKIEDGAKTTVQLATLPADGLSGGFFHMGEPLPWEGRPPTSPCPECFTPEDSRTRYHQWARCNLWIHSALYCRVPATILSAASATGTDPKRRGRPP